MIICYMNKRGQIVRLKDFDPNTPIAIYASNDQEIFGHKTKVVAELRIEHKQVAHTLLVSSPTLPAGERDIVWPYSVIFKANKKEREAHQKARQEMIKNKGK